MQNRAETNFTRLSRAGIVSLLLLILAGGVVRSSGSGMGCPDWPKCFNCWIPPTTVKDLPVGYQEAYLKKRLKKNQRAAGFFSWLGYKNLAYSIQHDPSVYLAENFNVIKTYTEYINRLFGVITGLVFVGAWMCSFAYLKRNALVFWAWSFALLLIGFQGWLGSIVVSSNLDSGLITVHMLLALLILALAIWAYAKSKSLRLAGGLMEVKSIRENEQSGIEQRVSTRPYAPEINEKKRLYLNFSVGLITLASLIQIVWGTRVRERIDQVRGLQGNSDTLDARIQWIKGAGSIFNGHRDFSLFLALGVMLIVLFVHRAYKGQRQLLRCANGSLLLTLGQIVLGVSLAYMGLPPFSQALHIFVASLVFGNFVYLFILLNDKGKVA